MAEGLSPARFIAKWSGTSLSERAASQEHFIDICRMLGQPTPAEHDATGAEYAFEKGVAVTGTASRGSGGHHGFADVWWKGKFGWEYKRQGKHRTLDDAYRQLCQYREALENPPLLIVCDISRTEIHTNFTGTAKQVHVIQLEELDQPENLDLLRRVFTDPDSFRPTITVERVTEEVAKQFGTLAQGLRDRGHDPHDAAHFLMKCMFCLFAEDVELLPKAIFERLVHQWKDRPGDLIPRMTDLFGQMRTGGAFGVDEIAHFNGGLFGDAPALELTTREIGVLLEAASQDWASVEPAVFGTLFERSLDPNTRAQIGAHYTSREDILLVVEPVVMAPLRQEWVEKQELIDEQLERRAKAKTKTTKKQANEAIENVLRGFLHRLSSVRVLDPACGSGNFLYVAIQQLLDLEKEVITFAAGPEIGVGLFPQVRPTQLHGIEINPYAAELAQVVIWIGYLQWMRDNGFIQGVRRPILEPIQSIECRDAILDLSDPEHPKAAEWPEAEFIVGNPPFLGSKVFRQQGLEDEYIEAMYASFDLPRSCDLCCYWFELGQRAVQVYQDTRVGLLATQGIRGGANRVVLERIKQTGDIFNAWSDRNWVLDGALVHVSIVGFDKGAECDRHLDAYPVPIINADLTSGLDLTRIRRLPENEGVYQRSPEKGGKFEIKHEIAQEWMRSPNPTGHPNSEVLKPWINGQGLIGTRDSKWIIDFPNHFDMATAATFSAPFQHLERHVKAFRAKNSDDRLRKYWWVHRRTGEGVRQAAVTLRRLLCTTMTSKHRLFRFIESHRLPDKGIPVFARSDDYFLGILHSAIHEVWARKTGTQLREAESGFRYIPTNCFETFALPWAPGHEPTDQSAYRRISKAAKELNDLRERWLNPPEWIDPIAAAVDAEDDFSDVPEAARGLIRESAIMARAAKDENLKRRTLTNLYNERPTWLRLAHEALDRAVLGAYGLVDPEGGWSEDWAEVWVETGAGQGLADGHALAERRAEVEQLVLGNLLRLNGERGTRN